MFFTDWAGAKTKTPKQNNQKTLQLQNQLVKPLLLFSLLLQAVVLIYSDIQLLWALKTLPVSLYVFTI